MNRSELWGRAEELFHRALGRSADEQAALLDAHRADPLLVAMVREMLAESSLDDGSEPPSRADAAAHPATIGGYEIVREIGRGGMGIVYEARQPRLDRSIALKVLRGASAGDGPATRERRMLGARRFMDEAQVLGRLDHPGIVPILELGETEDGVAFFTMRLVAGEDFRVVLAKVRAGTDGWNLARALSILQRTCDTLAFAHHRGVVHRDLKPSNLMVGAFGEVYLIDWGLARVSGRAGGDARGEGLETIDGDVVGTPAYMSPEQALGQIDRMGPWSDVYSLGAILYELLAGAAPHWHARGDNDAYALVKRVRRGAAPPLSGRKSIPPMLAAICDKAMARAIEQRYASVDALGRDLQAFLSNHVVAAYERGPIAELRMWCVRNRTLAWTAAAALAAVMIAAVVLGVMNRALTRTNDAVFRLSATRDLASLVGEVDDLWPTDGEHAAALAGWLGRADALLADLPMHRARRDDLRARALPWTAEEQERDRATHPSRAALDAGRARLETIHAMLETVKPYVVANATLPEDVARNEQIRVAVDGLQREVAEWNVELPRLEREVAERRTWRFAAGDDAWWHDQLERLVADLEALADPATGLRDGLSPEHGLGIARRLEQARTLAERTVDGPGAAELWRAAIAAIADRAQYPAYAGMAIAPQLGLLPLGRDPDSGLFEFWHPATGEAPRRDAAGRIELDAAMSLVFVLVPAGSFEMGAQSAGEGGANHDPGAQDDEGPVHRVDVPAFLLSKYEMTAAQWARVAGRDPSVNRDPAATRGGGLLPVENVPFDDAAEWSRRLGLALPTEEQWEYACRAGTATPWWCGALESDLAGRANLADVRFARTQMSTAVPADASLDDGFGVEAPIGSFAPNRFGLHDTIGNVLEWCANPWTHMGYVDTDASPELRSKLAHVARGGSFGSMPAEARSADRLPITPAYQAGLMFNGLRPSRALAPTPGSALARESR